MNEIFDYYKIFPQLPIEILLFFQQEIKKRQLVYKRVYAFSDYYQKKYKITQVPQPLMITTVCDILCNHGKLSLLQKDGIENVNGSYYSIIDERIKNDLFLQNHINKQLSYLIYGFKYIYEEYKKYVLPVEYTTKDDDIAIGTCFLYRGGIVTARHCIEGAKKIAIQGILQEKMQSATYHIHDNELMDAIFIRFKDPLVDAIICSDRAEVLDDIIAMGYPKIAGYHNFLTVEKATVSSRFTASIGQIASNAEDIWIRERLFLITAKIKGGNSGGPIIKKDGRIVGISVNLTKGEGDYDDLGYGTVIPISFINNIIENPDSRCLDVSSILFKNFNNNSV